jgi:hypothetical protein
MKIILNSITFVPLVQKLQNNKGAHWLVKDFPLPKVEPKLHDLGGLQVTTELYQNKQTNILINIFLI